MAKLDNDTQRTVSVFVDEMTEWRRHRGWTQQDLAERCTYSKSLIASVESYERAPTAGLAVALDKAFGLPGTFQRLHKRMGSLAFPPAFGEFAEVEGSATELCVWEHSYLPGLVQTEDYAHRMLRRHLDVTDEEVAERAAGRMKRQAVLTRAEPRAPVAWFLLDGQVLRRPVGTPQIMHAALANLASIAEMPNVTVQVVPVESGGGHPGLLGAFCLLEHEDRPTTLFSEDITDGRIIEDTATVRDVRRRWRYLCSLALSAEQSAALIKEEAERWKPQ